MDFKDAVDLFNYWAESPTLTMMVQSYFGVTEKSTHVDPIEMAAAMKVLGSGKAEKVSKAPPIDQERFAALRDQLKKMQAKENYGGR